MLRSWGRQSEVQNRTAASFSLCQAPTQSVLSSHCALMRPCVGVDPHQTVALAHQPESQIHAMYGYESLPVWICLNMLWKFLWQTHTCVTADGLWHSALGALVPN